MFYHIKNLQSTKTFADTGNEAQKFYHIKNLQSTKTKSFVEHGWISFITLRIYKVLKQIVKHMCSDAVLSH